MQRKRLFLFHIPYFVPISRAGTFKHSIDVDCGLNLHFNTQLNYGFNKDMQKKFLNGVIMKSLTANRVKSKIKITVLYK